MIDDELDRLKRIDLVRITAQGSDAVAHGREIHDRRNSGEILKEDTRRRKGDLFLLLGTARHIPAGERLDVGRLNEAPVFVAEEVLEQNLERIWQAGELGASGALERFQTEILDRPPVNIQLAARSKAVDTLRQGRP